MYLFSVFFRKSEKPISRWGTLIIPGRKGLEIFPQKNKWEKMLIQEQRL